MIKGHSSWTKGQWRKAAKEKRADLSLNSAELAVINQSLRMLLPSKPNAIISAYWPIGNELDTRPLLRFMAEQGIKSALPRVNVDGHGLLFHVWRWGEALVPSHFSLSEPSADLETLCSPDIVLLPLLAFDERGNRLGYGAGHYDRTLADIPKTLKVGLAFAEQITDMPLPAKIHDVRMDAVLTQDGVMRFK